MAESFDRGINARAAGKFVNLAKGGYAVGKGGKALFQVIRGGSKAAKTPSVLKVGDLKLPGVPKGATGTAVPTGKGLE
jgi:hypothetical protein